MAEPVFQLVDTSEPHDIVHEAQKQTQMKRHTK